MLGDPCQLSPLDLRYTGPSGRKLTTPASGGSRQNRSIERREPRVRLCRSGAATHRQPSNLSVDLADCGRAHQVDAWSGL